MNWGRVLIATGRALKPAKCFYHLTYFSWKPDMETRHGNQTGCGYMMTIIQVKPKFNIFVPLKVGTLAHIEHLPIKSPTKMLGLTT
jgi:hypothetical protein